MSGSDYFIRLAAFIFISATLIGVIVSPTAGRKAIERAGAAASYLELPAANGKACAFAQPPLAGPFADIEDVLSISPLGGVTAPGETLPAPYIRINTKRGETAFARRSTAALSPAKTDIVAIERIIERSPKGRAANTSWIVHFRPCESISFYYGRLDTISDDILSRAGGLRAFTELGGPDHLAVETNIRVQKGEFIGQADGFDIGLHDANAAPAQFEAPERYAANPFPRAAVFNAAPSLIDAISPKTPQARCPIDYLPGALRESWSAKLGDSWGIRKARGENACRTAIADAPGAARGVWFTDAAHNAAASRVSAVALSPDTIDPDRLIFALHGRLSSLTPEMIALPPLMDQEKAEATKDFLSFRKGDGRINPAFDNVRDNQIYCFEGLRTNFVGPQINGVILLQRKSAANGPAILKMEARADARSCIDLADPWAFTGRETMFYR
ncbi:MAG: hypothetical protein AAGD92_01135 [Pseudomonadota bacterium]